jgi:plastocyanin
MRKVLIVVVALLTVSVWGTLVLPASASTTRTAKMLGCIGANPRFKPVTITIHKGDKVRWVNPTASCHHTTESNKAGWNSGDVGPGGSFVHKFTKVGTFKYHCAYHSIYGMVGKVVVKA